MVDRLALIVGFSVMGASFFFILAGFELSNNTLLGFMVVGNGLMVYSIGVNANTKFEAKMAYRIPQKVLDDGILGLETNFSHEVNIFHNNKIISSKNNWKHVKKDEWDIYSKNMFYKDDSYYELSEIVKHRYKIENNI